MAPPPKNAGIRYPPPLLFALGLVGGWALGRAWPLPLVGPSLAGAAVVAGVTLALLALALGLWAVATFARFRTGILPHHASTAVVEAGPYRFTRNPMYLALTLGYVGASLVLDSAWPLVLLPAVIAVLYYTVIRKEERYLAALFGEAYAGYRRRVRRWL